MRSERRVGVRRSFAGIGLVIGATGVVTAVALGLAVAISLLVR
jgi:ABC-type lipoprotein release transport system permease subunit